MDKIPMNKKLNLKLNDNWFEYVGTKFLYACPMNRGDYNLYQGWTIPENENPTDEGYLVEYIDGGKPNHPDHRGYISWSPKGVFEKSYKKRDGVFNFSTALDVLKSGRKVARTGWNGKGMWLILTPGRVVNILEPNSFYEKCGFEAPVRITGHIDMKAADGSMVVGWLASQSDMLAEDWIVVEQ